MDPRPLRSSSPPLAIELEIEMPASAEREVVFGGRAVAEWLVRRDGLQPPLVACGTPDAFISEAGSQQWMREQCGLTGPAVAAKILARLGKSP
jgi:transketolase C-terminal domain/subunit